MKPTTKGLLTVVLVLILLLSGCASDDSSSDSGGSSSDSSLSEQMLSALKVELDNQFYSSSQQSTIISDARSYIAAQNLSNSSDISLVGNAIIYSLTNKSLASSSIAMTFSDKVRSIEIANGIFTRLLKSHIENVVLNASQTSNFSGTDADVYGYVLDGFIQVSISNLDAAGIFSDNVHIAVQGILITIFSELISAGANTSDIPQILYLSTRAVVIALQDSGVLDAQIPYLLNKAIRGAITGAQNLNQGDDWVLSATDEILEGFLNGLNAAGISGDLEELAVKGIKEGLDDGISLLTTLDQSTIDQFNDDIQNDPALSLLKNDLLSKIEIGLDKTSIPLGAYATVSITGYYYASDQTIDLLATATIETSANLSYANGKLEVITPAVGYISATYSTFNDNVIVTGLDAAIIGISIDPVIASLPKGKVLDFKAIATFSDDTTADVAGSLTTWTVNLTENYTLSYSGAFSGSQVGDNVNLTIEKDGYSDNIWFVISSAIVDYLDISPKNISIPKGKTEQYTLKEIYTDGAEIPVSTGITWTNADASGLATGSAEGDMIIEAEKDGLFTDTTLTVTQKELESIVIAPENAFITKGDSKQFSATGVYTDGTMVDKTDLVQWSAGFTALAFIIDYRTPATPNGMLSTSFTELDCDPPIGTSVDASCNATCDPNLYQSSTKTDQTIITVTKLPITSVALNQTEVTINESEYTTFTATATLSDDSTANITSRCLWSSSNNNVYAYDSPNRGRVRGDNVGSAIITATCDTFIKTATVTVQ